MIVLSLALRNMLRKPGRTAAALAVLSCGTAAVVVSGGFISYVMADMRDLYIRAFVGHLQIHRKGYSSEGRLRPYEFMLKDAEGLSAAVLSLPHVKAAAASVEFYGLLSTGETTFPVRGVGQEPAKEKLLTGGDLIRSGSGLEEADEKVVVVGRGVAEALRVKPGDELMLLANGKGGALNGTDVTVKGVFQTVSQAYDDYTVLVPLRTAQKLLRADSVHTIRVLLDDTAATDAALEGVLRSGERSGWELEVVPWYKIAEFVTKTGDFYDRIFLGLKVAIIVMVVLGIFNTLNMSIMERTGEIGTMLALGETRARVLAMFLVEGAVLGAVGGTLGMLVGAVLAKATFFVGIPMPEAPGTTLPWIARIDVVPAQLFLGFSIAMTASVVSSAFPAFKAARLEISAALRKNVGV